MLAFWQEHGARLCLAPGRPSRIMHDVPKQLLVVFDSIYCCNGAELFDRPKGRVLWSFCSKDLCRLLSTLVKEVAGIAFGFEFGGQFVCEEGYRYWPATEGDPAYKRDHLFSVLSTVEGVCKVLCRTPGMSTGQLSEQIVALDLCCSVSFSSGWGDIGPVELTPSGVSKASAVARQCSISSIAPEACIAFGNANNDLDMLGSVGRGFLVGWGDFEAGDRFTRVPSVASGLSLCMTDWGGRE